MKSYFLAFTLLYAAVSMTAFTAPCLAQIGPDPFFSRNQNNADINEVEDIDSEDAEINDLGADGDSKDVSKTDARELKLSQSELREDFTYGAAFGLGLHDPWQLVAVNALYLIQPDLVMPLSVGGGTLNLKAPSRKNPTRSMRTRRVYTSG